MGNKSFVFRFADLEVHEREFALSKAGEKLPVEPKAFRVLLLLLSSPQKLITKEELLDAVWPDAAVTENSLTRAVALLRRLIGDDARSPHYIETVATVGYRFICPVDVSEEISLTSVPAPESDSVEETQPDSSHQNRGNGETVPTSVPLAIDRTSAKGNGASVQRKPRGQLIAGFALILIVLAAATWYFARPLVPLRIREYVQITHDGGLKHLVGTDGTRLYFDRPFAPQTIAQVTIVGGDTVAIPVSLQLPWLADASSDGSSLLVGSNNGVQTNLWALQVPGGSLQHLATVASLADAKWSPDRKFIGYSTVQGESWVMRSDGTDPRCVAPGGNHLDWSPDGRSIGFTRENGLWIMSADGTGSHALLPGWQSPSIQCCGRWAGNGKFLVFLLAGSGTRASSQLWAIDERKPLLGRGRTEPVQLTSGPIRWFDPVPDKDGKTIFARGVIPRGELVRYDASVKANLPWLGGISAEFVAFSPDGKSIVYVTFPEGVLWKANRDGSNPIQLTSPPHYPINPHWSPNGSQILYSEDDPSGKYAYLVSAQGGPPRKLLPSNRGEQTDPNWSPDGKEVVFSPAIGLGSAKTDIRIVDLATGQIRILPGSSDMWSPRWSPDGQHILAIGGTSELRLFNIGSQQWSVLLDNEECDFPTYSADGRFVYFFRVRHKDPGIYRIPAAGRAMERVVDLNGFRQTGVFGLWMALDPQGAPMMLRDVGTDDIYALPIEAP